MSRVDDHRSNNMSDRRVFRPAPYPPYQPYGGDHRGWNQPPYTNHGSYAIPLPDCTLQPSQSFPPPVQAHQDEEENKSTLTKRLRAIAFWRDEIKWWQQQANLEYTFDETESIPNEKNTLRMLHNVFHNLSRGSGIVLRKFINQALQNNNRSNQLGIKWLISQSSKSVGVDAPDIKDMQYNFSDDDANGSFTKTEKRCLGYLVYLLSKGSGARLRWLIETFDRKETKDDATKRNEVEASLLVESLRSFVKDHERVHTTDMMNAIFSLSVGAAYSGTLSAAALSRQLGIGKYRAESIVRSTQSMRENNTKFEMKKRKTRSDSIKPFL